MAIIINDRSICPICQKVIRSGDEVVGFPHFCGDPNNPLYFFTDTGFHKSCFLNHPLRDEVMAAVERYDNGESTC